MELTKIYCPECKSQEVKKLLTYDTKNNGSSMLYECCCERVFSETKNTFLQGLSKPVSLIVLVVKARTEGMAFNAACRTFGIAKNTLINWEMRLASLKKTLFLFALVHEFLKLVIEGDELYTKALCRNNLHILLVLLSVFCVVRWLHSLLCNLLTP